MGCKRTFLFIRSGNDLANATSDWSTLIPALRARGSEVVLLDLDARGLSRELWHVRRGNAFTVAPDLVVTHGVTAQIVGELVASRYDVPHLVTEYAAGQPRLRIDRRIVMRLTAPHVDAIVATSRTQLPRLVECGYPPTRIRVIQGASPPLRPRSPSALVRASFGLCDDDFVALLVADPEREHIARRAVVLANVTDARIRGVLAGGGSRPVPAGATGADDDQVVRQAGDGHDLADLVNAADVVCLWSVREDEPTILYDAMSVGKPTIATDTRANRDAVVPDETGVLVRPDDDVEGAAQALVELGADRARGRALGSEGKRRHAHLFGVERMVAEYADILDQVAAEADERTPPQLESEEDSLMQPRLPNKLARHLNSALSRGVGYEFTPPGEFFGGPSIRGYYIDFRAKTTSPSARRPEQLLPAGLAQLALGWWERSLAGEPQAADEFRRVCVLLEESAEQREGQLLWPYDITVRKYPLAWPPYSALAQAQAASVFVRAHLRSGDPRDAELAQGAIRSLVHSSSDLVATTPSGPILEESPGEPASHILNGWIYALWGLRDVHLGLESAEAAVMYEASLSCLRTMIDLYDVGWWTRYSLYPHKLPDLAKPFYHRLHVDQVDILFGLTGFPEFGEAARRWRSYDTSLNWARAIAHKSLFVSTGYA